MIDYIKDFGKTELLEPRFFTSLTAGLCLLNPSSPSKTSNEQDQVGSLEEIYNLFCIPFRATDLSSLFFEGMNNDFVINFISTESNSNFLNQFHQGLFREDIFSFWSFDVGLVLFLISMHEYSVAK